MFGTLLGMFGGKSSGGLLKTGLKIVDELYESDEEKNPSKDDTSRY